MDPNTITTMQAVAELRAATLALRRAGEFDAAVGFQEAREAVRDDARAGDEFPGPRLRMACGALKREGYWGRVHWEKVPRGGFRIPYVVGTPQLEEAHERAKAWRDERSGSRMFLSESQRKNAVFGLGWRGQGALTFYPAGEGEITFVSLNEPADLAGVTLDRLGVKTLVAKLQAFLDDRCRCVFRPGVLRPWGRDPRTPNRPTRCALPAGHEGEHSWGPLKETPPEEDDDEG